MVGTLEVLTTAETPPSPDPPSVVASSQARERLAEGGRWGGWRAGASMPQLAGNPQQGYCSKTSRVVSTTACT